MLINTVSPHGGDIYKNRVDIDFSANINPYGMPPEVRAALEASLDACSAYPDPYCTKLREKIAEAENVPQSSVICGNGAAELIYQFAYALDDARPALIVSPTFCEYEQALDAAGVRCEKYYLKESDGFRLTKEFLRVDFSRYSAVVICSPNNPTGITIEREIIESAAGSGARMLCDFCFLDLTSDPGRYDIPSLTERHPNIFVLKAFTKSYAMAGLRLGYAVCRDGAFLERMSKKAQCWNVSTPAQAAGSAAVGCREWLGRTVSMIAAEREYLARRLGALGITVYPGEANYLMLKAREDLARETMRRGIMIRDCSGYDGLGEGYFRIAVRTREENERLIAAVKSIMNSRDTE